MVPHDSNVVKAITDVRVIRVVSVVKFVKVVRVARVIRHVNKGISANTDPH